MSLQYPSPNNPNWASPFENLLSYPKNRGDNEQKRKNLLHSMKNKKSNSRSRRRAPLACERCRSRKIKCSGENGGNPCTNCRSSGWTCTFKRMGCTEEIPLNIPTPIYYPPQPPPVAPQMTHGYDAGAATLMHPSYTSMNSSMDSLLSANAGSASPSSLAHEGDRYRGSMRTPSSNFESPRTVHSVAASDISNMWAHNNELLMQQPNDVGSKGFDFSAAPVPIAVVDHNAGSIDPHLDLGMSTTAPYPWVNMCFDNMSGLMTAPEVTKGGPVTAIDRMEHPHPSVTPEFAAPSHTNTSDISTFNDYETLFTNAASEDDFSFLMDAKPSITMSQPTVATNGFAFDNHTAAAYQQSFYDHF